MFKKFIFLSIVLFSVSSAQAEIQVYVEIPGIPGESTATGNVGEIIALGAGGNFSKKSCGGFFIEKQLDLATPLLISSAITGRVFTSITIDYIEHPAGPRLLLATTTLNGATLYSVETSTIDDSRPTELVTIMSNDITVEYNLYDDTGAFLGMVTENVVCSKK